MKSSTKNAPRSIRDVAYYQRRYENRCYEKLVGWITTECQKQQITKKELAERMGKDPGQLSRLLTAPSNLTLNTITDLLLALDAEAEPPEIVKFSDRRAPNYIHPLVRRALGKEDAPTVQSSDVITSDAITIANRNTLVTETTLASLGPASTIGVATLTE